MPHEGGPCRFRGHLRVEDLVVRGGHVAGRGATLGGSRTTNLAVEGGLVLVSCTEREVQEINLALVIRFDWLGWMTGS